MKHLKFNFCILEDGVEKYTTDDEFHSETASSAESNDFQAGESVSVASTTTYGRTTEPHLHQDSGIDEILSTEKFLTEEEKQGT